MIKYGVRGAEADLDGLVQGKVSEPFGFDEGFFHWKPLGNLGTSWVGCCLGMAI